MHPNLHRVIVEWRATARILANPELTAQLTSPLPDEGHVDVDVERLRRYLSSVCPSKAEVVAEADGWSIFFPGLPVAADGSTFDEAVSEMVDALREYVEDWQERLRLAPDHQGNWGLVQLIVLSDDDQLTEWLEGMKR